MKRGRPKKQLNAKEFDYWSSLDWNYRDSFLARRHKKHYQMVRTVRLMLGIPAGKKGHINQTPKGRAVNRKVKVSVRELRGEIDVRIAEKHGISRERVRQLRKEAGLPPSNGRTPGGIPWESVADWSLPRQTIAESLECSVAAVYWYLRKRRERDSSSL